MKEQTWVAVDGHGNEYAFNEEPRRDFPNMDLRVKWGQRWTTGTSLDPARRRYGVKLPKGTIEILTGKLLTYADEAVLVEFEDYGNYENPEGWEELVKKEDDEWLRETEKRLTD